LETFYVKAPQEAINVKNNYRHYSNDTIACLLITEKSLLTPT